MLRFARVRAGSAAPLLAAAILASAACAQAGRAPRAATPGQAALEAELMRADAAFAAATAERGFEGWMSWFADSARMLAGAEVVRGKDAMRPRMAPGFSDSTRHLSWHPVSAEVSADGSLGYTLGRYELAGRAADGTSRILATGRYMTVWRRQADGAWKVVADLGGPDPAPKPQ